MTIQKLCSIPDITYSVIIPHYGQTTDYLSRAVASIPDDKDIEIIVVDNSVVELNFSSIITGRKNLKILFSDKTKGAGAARNTGIKNSNGKWLLFLDADDFFLANAFDTFNLYKKSDCDLIFFKANSIYDTGETADRHIYYNSLIDDYLSSGKKTEEKLRYRFFVPWCKMISSSFVKRNGFLYDEVLASNDMMFAVKTGHFANKILATNELVCCITVVKGSLTNKKTLGTLEARYETNLRLNKFLMEVNKKKYQLSVMFQLISSIKYGFSTFFKFLRMLNKYDNNIFIGFSNWFKTAIEFHKTSMKVKRYITK